MLNYTNSAILVSPIKLAQQNQLTGFHMKATLAFNGLNRAEPHVSKSGNLQE